MFEVEGEILFVERTADENLRTRRSVALGWHWRRVKVKKPLVWTASNLTLVEAGEQRLRR